jgi:hypothetical protein
MGSAGGMELAEQLTLCAEQHIEAFADGLVAEGLSDMTFARAGGASDEHTGFLFDEVASSQLHDLGSIDGGVKGEVEILQGLLIAE